MTGTSGDRELRQKQLPSVPPTAGPLPFTSISKGCSWEQLGALFLASQTYSAEVPEMQCSQMVLSGELVITAPRLPSVGIPLRYSPFYYPPEFSSPPELWLPMGISWLGNTPFPFLPSFPHPPGIVQEQVPNKPLMHLISGSASGKQPKPRQRSVPP